MSNVAFNIVAHDFFVTEQAIDELYIYIKREMRRSPFLGMKQPSPIESCMGMDTILTMKYKGQVANNFKWYLYKNDELVQSDVTDESGISYGLNIELSNGICNCQPQAFRRKSKLDNLNLRCCHSALPNYKLEVVVKEAVEGASPVPSTAEGQQIQV